MIKTSLAAALTLAAFAGTARADKYHAYPAAEQRTYDGLYEQRSAVATPAPRPQPQPQSDFGSFSTANTAHTLGY